MILNGLDGCKIYADVKGLNDYCLSKTYSAIIKRVDLVERDKLGIQVKTLDDKILGTFFFTAEECTALLGDARASFNDIERLQNKFVNAYIHDSKLIGISIPLS